MIAHRGARRRERTRTRLVEGARRVIATKGFDASTIADITAEGRPPPTPVGYLPRDRCDSSASAPRMLAESSRE